MIDLDNPFKQPAVPRILPEVLGESVGITNLRAQVAHLLSRQGHGRTLPILLLLGETGTGKGLLARAIHRASIRAVQPFVDVDCAAIPETLLEVELFGVERGAFTDARESKPGLFQTARGGTLLLDEVGLLPKMLQGKLLKVVEERAVRRLGSTQVEVVDVWVLAATNVDLGAAARHGSFREDLYHRLAAVTLLLPPLRARHGDIPLLADHFLARACAEYRLPSKTLAPDARAAMMAYQWPGNVRELANMLERVVLMSGDDTVISGQLLALPSAKVGPQMRPAAPKAPCLRSRVDAFEREHLLEALRSADGNITVAAARLGLPRNTLRYRMVKLGIGRDPRSITWRPGNSAG
jgi:transcriptional regulator with PAS, ATPase and Fis domain